MLASTIVSWLGDAAEGPDKASNPAQASIVISSPALRVFTRFSLESAERGFGSTPQPFVDRDVVLAVDCDRDQPGAGLERRTELAELAEGRCSIPNSAATRAGSSPVGVPSNASNSLPESAPAWGRKWKIAPPPLSMTTMRTGEPASRRASRPPRSWKRQRSPRITVAGLRLATAAPIPEETKPSIPLVPRLARKWTSAGPPVTNSSWSRIGMLEAV